MFSMYLKIISRFFLKNRIFSFINIFGLAIGLTASILILQYVFYELSYDKHIPEGDHIYRIQQDRFDKGVLSTQWANGCGSIGIAMKNAFPEVEEFVRLFPAERILVRNGEKAFKEDRFFFSTNRFFEVFPYKILNGNKENLLTEPYHIILTKEMAQKYFGNEDPIGKSIKLNAKRFYQVEAVVESAPANSHFKFDFLISWSTFDILRETEVNEDNTWFWDGFYNYIKLHPSTDVKELESKIPALVEDKWGEVMRRYNTSAVYHLQAIKDIHLFSDYMGEMENGANGKAVKFLFFIALFLIIIAWINYINLSTARSIERAKEVGLKKVVGASKKSLIRQFLFESLMMNLLSILLSLFIIWIISPSFTLLTGKEVNFAYLLSSKILIYALLIYITGSLIAGLYPALVLSSYKPIQVLKGSFKNSKQGIVFRKALVIFQFMISFVLISGTMIIFSQISFMRNQEKNFDNEDVLVINGPIAQDSTYSSRYSTFKNEVLQKADIQSFSASNSIPGKKPEWNAGGIRLEGAAETESLQYRIMAVGYDFQDLYKLEILKGRFFSEEFGKDNENILMNEAGMRLIGFNHPDSILNQRIFFWGNVYNVIGVIKDYNHESLKKNYQPLIFRLRPNTQSFYSIRLHHSANKNKIINEINDLWVKHYPSIPYEYFFAEEYYNEQYKEDNQYGIIFGMFSVLAIIIACLGLFGLASYSSIQRTKEVGIRKVLGATVGNIVKIFSLEYLKLMIIAIILGGPICYFLMDKWLQNFANHINIYWWLLVIPAILLGIITLITISSNAIKSGLSNPVDSLKYE